MNFKSYDILSSLIPGFIMLLAYLPFLGFEYNKDYIIGYTTIAFGLGYLINTVGSWLEDFYFFTWGGRPSSNLLDGKGIWKIRLYNHTEIKNNLKSKSQNSNPCNKELFSIAMRYVCTSKDNRMEDFSNNYAFSRTMLTCSVLSSITIFANYYYDWRAYLSIPIIIIFWYRVKQRAYYFSKEIFQIYSKIENI
ncbi:hypothetical protein [Flavobacterium chilense]|uniref:Uncharacterized protein n=1 Tax=Flavobacterium chilense TaxID=946677 RepID=A0A1M7D772_9FLAO|nr:hypothetical protein [Flavobacterium chilense]SHL75300.1 hypothetical protein SAMN05444484_102457 [Flavobacterium chilense]